MSVLRFVTERRKPQTLPKHPLYVKERSDIGSDPIEVSPGKWPSQDGRWQYRAKPGDVSDNHVHVEQLDPRTGEGYPESPLALAGRNRQKMNVGYVETSISSSSDNDYLKLSVSSANLIDWCINLAALEKEVIESIRLTNSQEDTIGILSISSRQRNSFTSGQYKKIKISLSAIDYWIAFLLRYVQNGIAEVDHIDIDAGLDDENSQDRSITLLVDKPSPPRGCQAADTKTEFSL